MRTVARIQLEKGMELAEDVFDYKNNLLFPAGTIVDEQCIAKLSRHSVMAVNIKDMTEHATTHYEKVRYSVEFSTFEKEYFLRLKDYKNLFSKLLNEGRIPSENELISLYASVRFFAKEPEKMLDYLYNMLPSEDDMTYAHCFNSALIAGVFSEWLKLSEEDTKLLILCGFYFDIGKLMLPHELIWKPGRLTPEEFARMKTHTVLGFEFLLKCKLNDNIVKAALLHHERFDGTGYPTGAKGNGINRFARYMSIIDAYEAMTSARTYRQSLNPFQVIENFENAGSFQYDTNMLNAILFRIASAQVGLTVKLSNDTEGEVIFINQRKLSRPFIKINNTPVDLSSMPSLKITSVV